MGGLAAFFRLDNPRRSEQYEACAEAVREFTKA